MADSPAMQGRMSEADFFKAAVQGALADLERFGGQAAAAVKMFERVPDKIGGDGLIAGVASMRVQSPSSCAVLASRCGLW